MTIKETISKSMLKSAEIKNSYHEAVKNAPPELRRRAKQILTVAVVLFVAVSGYKWVSYKFQQRQLARELAAGPIVRVAKVTQSPGEHQTSVIGETRPYQSATLYAKVSGYLKKVSVDKGDVVKTGQIMAVIESPETDEAFEAAQADSRNKGAIGNRMTALLRKGLVSQQEAEQAQSDAAVAAARLRSEATLRGYETLRAPFDGTVTARYADPGALVQNATSSQASALPVVTVSQINRLRVDMFIDQRDAPYVQKDSPVQITLNERPGFSLTGRVDRISGELDPRTKMLLVEIDIPNEKQELVAGSFVQVAMTIRSPSYLESPVESLALKDNKTYLAVLKPDNTLTYKPVQLAGNDGKTLQIASGAEAGETVILNVGASLKEGAKVRPAGAL